MIRTVVLLASVLAGGMGLTLYATLGRIDRLTRRIAPYAAGHGGLEPAGVDGVRMQKAGRRPAGRIALVSPRAGTPLLERMDATLATLGRALGRLGGEQRLASRLAMAGRTEGVSEYRTSQALWGIVGLTVGLGIALALGRARGAPIAAQLALAVAAAAAAMAVKDYTVTRDLRRRRSRILEELPALAELLALSVTAGESVHAGLLRIARSARGEAAREIGQVVASVAAGSTLVDALDDRCRVSPVPALTRLYQAIATAVERGTPLAGVLHAQAEDVRSAGHRSLLETGGRREVAMMVPVVFLILPVTILFALFPGIVSLRFLT